MSAPLGLRLNNPGNLRPFADGQTWRGQTGAQSGFCVFDTPENGLRALAIDLLNQQRLHGLHTVAAIITKYAPAADDNDTVDYIDAVAHHVAVLPDWPIDMTNPVTLRLFMEAVVTHEQGQQPYDTATLSTSVTAAIA